VESAIPSVIEPNFVVLRIAIEPRFDGLNVYYFSQLYLYCSQNISLLPGAIASQSSTSFGGVAERAIDGNTSGICAEGSVTHTDTASNPFWKLEWSGAHRIVKIKVWNRTNAGMERIIGFVLTIHLNGNEIWSSTSSAIDTSTIANSYEFPIDDSVHGDEVIVTLPGHNKILSLAEVEVFGTPTP